MSGTLNDLKEALQKDSGNVKQMAWQMAQAGELSQPERGKYALPDITQ